MREKYMVSSSIDIQLHSDISVLILVVLREPLTSLAAEFKTTWALDLVLAKYCPKHRSCSLGDLELVH